MKLKHNFEMVELDNQIVAVPVNTGNDSFRGVVKLNSSSKEIFDLLSENTTEQEICQNLYKKYIDQEQTIRSYVHDVISELTKEGLLQY